MMSNKIDSDSLLLHLDTRAAFIHNQSVSDLAVDVWKGLLSRVSEYGTVGERLGVLRGLAKSLFV